MPQIFVNNGRARLAAAVSATSTTISLTDIVGLPTSLASGDWFLLSISRNDSRYGSNHEVVRVTGISGNTYTVVRGHEGAAVPHDITEVGEARSTADTHARMLREAVWAHVSDKPATATRWPAWGEVTGKPGAFTPVTHTHPWAEVSGAPATATRWPAWDEVTGKPLNFPPSTHSHAWSQIVGAPAEATRWPTYAEVTNKPSTTASRTNTSTSTLLQAKGMHDHRLSGDHDDRYHTKAEGDARYAQVAGANTLAGDLTINRPSAATAGLTLTGGRTDTAGAVGSLSLVNAQDGNATGSLEAWRRAAGTLDLEILGFAKTKIASAVEMAAGLTLQNAGYNNIDLFSGRTTGDVGGIRWHANGTKAGELNFTATGLIHAASGAKFSGDGSTLTNLDAGALASGTVPAARLSGSYIMNASTASALQTSRTINGTSFNGTANITTANWGTARTITIGSTGKSVNGSANVSWTLAELGAAAASHGHSADDLTSGTVANARLPATATRWPTWNEVTSKPGSFTPAAHNHSADEVTSGVLAKARIPTIDHGDTSFANQVLNTGSSVQHAKVRTGGAVDDGVNSLQVAGGTRTDTLAAGNVQAPTESIETDGNVKVHGEGQMQMGDFAIQYNAATQSLDFNWIGG